MSQFKAADSKSKRIAQNTIFMYIRMIITMGIALFTSRIVLNALGETDFGIYTLVGGMVVLFSFINSAMMAATQRFVNFELGSGNQHGLSEVFKTAYIIHIIIAVFLIIVGLSLGRYLVDVKLQIPERAHDSAIWVLYFSILTVAIQILSLPFNADIIAHEKFNIFAFISIFESAAKLGVAYLIMLSHERLVLYAALLFAVQLISAFINIIYCRRHFPEVRGSLHIYKGKLKEMSSFACWSLIGCTSAAFSNQGISVLLGLFFPPVVNAAKGLSSQVQGAISTFGYNVNMAMTPQITQSYASGDWTFFFNLLYRGSKYVFFMMVLVAIPILIKTDYILQIWLGKVPAYTSVFVNWMVCACMIEAISNPLMRASDASGKIKIYHTIVGGVLLTILPLAYIGLRLTHNPVIVVQIYFAVAALAWLARLLVLRHTIHLSIRKYFTEVLVRVVAIFTLSLTICWFISSHFADSILGLIATCGVSTLVSSLLIYTIGCDRAERRFVNTKFALLYNKIK